jgi:hypothetical protein
MNKYKLVNPYVVSKSIPSFVKADNSYKAAKQFFESMSATFSNSVPVFYFSIIKTNKNSQNGGGKENLSGMYHFKVNEVLNNDNTKSNYSIRRIHTKINPALLDAFTEKYNENIANLQVKSLVGGKKFNKSRDRSDSNNSDSNDSYKKRNRHKNNEDSDNNSYKKQNKHKNDEDSDNNSYKKRNKHYKKDDDSESDSDSSSSVDMKKHKKYKKHKKKHYKYLRDNSSDSSDDFDFKLDLLSDNVDAYINRRLRNKRSDSLLWSYMPDIYGVRRTFIPNFLDGFAPIVSQPSVAAAMMAELVTSMTATQASR